MSDRYIALTVLLEKPVKDEDAQGIINAIECLRGVMKVTPVVQEPQTAWAQESARRELGEQLMRIVYPNLYK